MSRPEREQQIRELLPIVRQIARRVRAVVGAADFDDLVGDGSIGLVRAVDTFDPARGTQLELYARRLVLGAMLNGIRRSDPVSERVRRTLRRVEARRFELAQQRGTLPTFTELEREDPAVRRARTSAYRQAALSLDAPLGPVSDPLADRTADPAARSVEAERARQLREAVALLPERERRIVGMHYASGLTLLAISKRMAVSPQRVSQLHLSALGRMRLTVAE